MNLDICTAVRGSQVPLDLPITQVTDGICLSLFEACTFMKQVPENFSVSLPAQKFSKMSDNSLSLSFSLVVVVSTVHKKKVNFLIL